MENSENIQSAKEELALLKERADLMGIKYSNNISIETLKNKINEKLEASEIVKDEQSKKIDIRKKVRDEELKLIRIRLQVMNPAKLAWRGEIFTVANSIIGTVKKFVPYDAEFYTNGYHVPNCIYKMLKEKEYLHISTSNQNGKQQVTTQFVPEFSITVLPPLTKEELEQLAIEQAAGNRIDN